MKKEIAVPFHFPEVGEEEIDEVVSVLRSGWLTTGPRTQQFEREFATYTSAPHALAVNSCTAGLHLALAGLNIGPGDEVITTPLTFCATVNTILHVGATPILADIGADFNIDPNCIEKRITSRTRAILPVHYAGLPCRMDEIWSLARRHGLYVVEDAAHAAGALYRGRAIGAAGANGDERSAAVAFSFYATKNMTTGEGGMVTTHDPELAAKMRRLCLHGIEKDAWNRYSDTGSWYYEVTACGFKYNLTDIQSALGLHQLRKLDRFTAAREEIVRAYNNGFQDMEEFELPPNRADSRHAWHLYPLRLNLDRLTIDRAEFIRELKRARIGASVHFIPIPLHPFFASHAGRPENYCPVAMDLYPRLVSLPLFPGMTAEQIDHVVATVREIAARFVKSDRTFVVTTSK